MIVLYQKRMAPLAVAKTEMTLEIHLPQVVRLVTFPSAKRLVFFRILVLDTTVAMQDRRNRARGRDALVAKVQQALMYLASTPGRMLPANRENCVLGFFVRLAGRTLRTTRLLGKSLLAL